jgi:hypothetical protein
MKTSFSHWCGFLITTIVLVSCTTPTTPSLPNYPVPAVERSRVAHEAQDKMLGFKKEQVLACMGIPANKATEGGTEVWSYNSSNDKVVGSSFGTATTNASMYGGRGYATGQGNTLGVGVGIASRRFCTVNVVMTKGVVTRINYIGPTGGLMTPDEQCAFAVQNCMQ